MVTPSFPMDLEKKKEAAAAAAAFQAAIPPLTDHFHAEKTGIRFSSSGPIPPGAVDENEAPPSFPLHCTVD